MQFSAELRPRVAAGEVTLSFRLWRRPQVKVGGRYPVGPAGSPDPVMLEVDAVELQPFSAITAADVVAAGEADLESLRQRAAHAGPIDGDTLVYRVEFHLLD